MDRLAELKSKLEEERPVSWEVFPDIPLYMDQIVSYMARQLVEFEGEGRLTPAMINNYIKDGLLPRADGKKYGKEHIAYLTAICVFKQIVPVRDIRVLLKKATGEDGIEPFYARLTALMDREMKETAQKIPETFSDLEIASTAIELAVSAYCGQFLCKRLIRMLAEKDSEPDTAHKKRKGK